MGEFLTVVPTAHGLSHVDIFVARYNANGTLEARIPYTDNCASRGLSGSMCAIPARMSRPDRDDIVIVNHHNSKMLLIQNKTRGKLRE